MKGCPLAEWNTRRLAVVSLGLLLSSKTYAVVYVDVDTKVGYASVCSTILITEILLILVSGLLLRGWWRPRTPCLRLCGGTVMVSMGTCAGPLTQVGQFRRSRIVTVQI